MRLEANYSSVRAVALDRYAESVEVKPSDKTLFTSPFPTSVKVEGQGGYTRYCAKATPAKCAKCNLLFALNDDGLCLRCVVEAMPRQEPAEECFE